MDESVELILARMPVNALGQHAINGCNGSESTTRPLRFEAPASAMCLHIINWGSGSEVPCGCGVKEH